jgi:LPPG:FO 2-phospho-L-lactate transferase
MITVLCGGVGGSRFLRALVSVVAPERITAIVNTGDDDEFHGLYVSPDPDIVTYALAGEVDDGRGWGLRGDTFRWLDALRRFGRETWFRIGDRDLATHLHRTRLLSEGWTLSQVTADIARAFGVRVRLLPMSDDPVRTVVTTDDGDLSFQRYLVERHASPPVRAVRFDGADTARPAPAVLDAIAEADAVLIAPSNPVGSIWPILSVPGIRDALAHTRRPRVAVSPIIGGRSLQPPAGEMMAGLGLAVDIAGVAEAYAGLTDALVIDEVDAAHATVARARGITPVIAGTVMSDVAASRRLAHAALRAAALA